MVARSLVLGVLISFLVASLNVHGIRTKLETDLKHVEINGIRVAYRDYKLPDTPNRVFVFLHGLGGSSVDWMLITENVRKLGRCILIDIPPFGLSEKRKDFDYSDENTVKLILNLLDSLGVDKFNLVGHSMGGYLSLIIASTLPERVEKLILISPAVFQSGNDGINTIINNEEGFVGQINLSKSGTRILAMMLDGSFKFYPAFRFLYQGSKPRLEKAREKHLDLTYAQNFFVPGEVWLKFALDKIKQKPYPVDFSRITAETIIIFGTNDAIVSPEIGEYLSKKIKKSKLVLIEGGEHLLMFDRRCVTVVTDFLR